MGTSGAFPETGRSAAGFLLKSEDGFILLDHGNGTLSRLQKYCDPRRLSGILITHLHPDHTLDLYMLQVLMEFDGHGAAPLVLHGPEDTWEKLLSFLPKDEGFRKAFDFRPYDGQSFDIGGCYVSTYRTKHPGHSYALRLEGEKTVFYTGDTGYLDELTDAARNADLLIAECTFTSDYKSVDFHLNAKEAGVFAREAGVSKLMLTHFWPGLDREKARREAQEVFEGEVLIAEEDTPVEL